MKRAVLRPGLIHLVEPTWSWWMVANEETLCWLPRSVSEKCPRGPTGLETDLGMHCCITMMLPSPFFERAANSIFFGLLNAPLEFDGLPPQAHPLFSKPKLYMRNLLKYLIIIRLIGSPIFTAIKLLQWNALILTTTPQVYDEMIKWNFWN